MFDFLRPTLTPVTAENALAGRATPVLAMPFGHRVFTTSLDVDLPGTERAYLAMGCFWGAEKLWWQVPGVVMTAVGYQGGFTPNPTYQEVCTGRTGHAETVRVTFDPSQISFAQVVQRFFERHDPTQANRQGNDVGTQYRSAIFTCDQTQQETAETIRNSYQEALDEAGRGQITTEIEPAGPFYHAEDYHQQYLQANPGGYDCHVRTRVACPLPQ